MTEDIQTEVNKFLLDRIRGRYKPDVVLRPDLWEELRGIFEPWDLFVKVAEPRSNFLYCGAAMIKGDYSMSERMIAE